MERCKWWVQSQRRLIGKKGWGEVGREGSLMFSDGWMGAEVRNGSQECQSGTEPFGGVCAREVTADPCSDDDDDEGMMDGEAGKV